MIRVEYDDTFLDALGSLSERIVVNSQVAAVETAKIIGEQIVQDARDQLIADGHVDTGKLLDSIHYEVDDQSDGKNGDVVLTVLSDATNENGEQYGNFIEALDPFLSPSVEENAEEIDAEFNRLFVDLMQNS